MPKLTTFKAIRKAKLNWQIKIDNVKVFYKWSDKRPDIDIENFILVDYDKKEWYINYITPEKIYYATINDITGQCSITIKEIN